MKLIAVKSKWVAMVSCIQFPVVGWMTSQSV